MIYVLHGDNTFASYSKLQILLKKYQGFNKIQLSQQQTFQDYFMTVFGKNMLFDKKIIICEEFISQKKIQEKDLEKIPEDIDIFFWEKGQIKIKKKIGTNTLYIEEFKIPADTYYFLDALLPTNLKKTLQLLLRLDTVSSSLIWNLTNRVLLLILAKKGLSKNETGEMLQRKFEDWQWQKIQAQSAQFDKTSIQTFFNDLLKIDYLKKQGKTEAADQTLISLLLAKHLKPHQMLE